MFNLRLKAFKVVKSLKIFFVLLILLFTSVSNKAISQSLLKNTKIDSISMFFAFGKFDYSAKKTILRKLNNLKNLPELANMKIQIKGFTDTVGNVAFNKKLASDRISTALEIVNSSNLKKVFIDTFNLNESQFTNDLKDKDFRRVDIIIYKVEKEFKLNTSIPLRINFLTTSSVFVPGSEMILGELLYVMKGDSTLKLKLNGHVCCFSNYQLSLQRATAVKVYLMKNGIQSRRMECEGFSNNKKLVDEVDDESQKKNMRVEVVFSR